MGKIIKLLLFLIAQTLIFRLICVEYAKYVVNLDKNTQLKPKPVQECTED